MRMLSHNQESDIIEMITQKIIDNNPELDFTTIYNQIAEDHFQPFICEVFENINQQ